MPNKAKTAEPAITLDNSISISEDCFTSIVRHYVLQIPEVVQFASASLEADSLT